MTTRGQELNSVFTTPKQEPATTPAPVNAGIRRPDGPSDNEGFSNAWRPLVTKPPVVAPIRVPTNPPVVPVPPVASSYTPPALAPILNLNAETPALNDNQNYLPTFMYSQPMPSTPAPAVVINNNFPVGNYLPTFMASGPSPGTTVNKIPTIANSHSGSGPTLVGISLPTFMAGGPIPANGRTPTTGGNILPTYMAGGQIPASRPAPTSTHSYNFPSHMAQHPGHGVSQPYYPALVPKSNVPPHLAPITNPQHDLGGNNKPYYPAPAPTNNVPPHLAPILSFPYGHFPTTVVHQIPYPPFSYHFNAPVVAPTSGVLAPAISVPTLLANAPVETSVNEAPLAEEEKDAELAQHPALQIPDEPYEQPEPKGAPAPVARAGGTLHPILQAGEPPALVPTSSVLPPTGPQAPTVTLPTIFAPSENTYRSPIDSVTQFPTVEPNTDNYTKDENDESPQIGFLPLNRTNITAYGNETKDGRVSGTHFPTISPAPTTETSFPTTSPAPTSTFYPTWIDTDFPTTSLYPTGPPTSIATTEPTVAEFPVNAVYAEPRLLRFVGLYDPLRAEKTIFNVMETVMAPYFRAFGGSALEDFELDIEFLHDYDEVDTSYQTTSVTMYISVNVTFGLDASANRTEKAAFTPAVATQLVESFFEGNHALRLQRSLVRQGVKVRDMRKVDSLPDPEKRGRYSGSDGAVIDVNPFVPREGGGGVLGAGHIAAIVAGCLIVAVLGAVMFATKYRPTRRSFGMVSNMKGWRGRGRSNVSWADYASSDGSSTFPVKPPKGGIQPAAIQLRRKREEESLGGLASVASLDYTYADVAKPGNSPVPSRGRRRNDDESTLEGGLISSAALTCLDDEAPDTAISTKFPEFSMYSHAPASQKPMTANGTTGPLPPIESCPQSPVWSIGAASYEFMTAADSADYAEQRRRWHDQASDLALLNLPDHASENGYSLEESTKHSQASSSQESDESESLATGQHSRASLSRVSVARSRASSRRSGLSSRRRARMMLSKDNETGEEEKSVDNDPNDVCLMID